MLKIINIATGAIVAAYPSKPVAPHINPNWAQYTITGVQERHAARLDAYSAAHETAKVVLMRLNNSINGANLQNDTKMPGYALIDTEASDEWSLYIEATLST